MLPLVEEKPAESLDRGLRGLPGRREQDEVKRRNVGKAGTDLKSVPGTS